MSKTIKISTKVDNSSPLVSLEVEGVITDVIEQFFDAGFEPDDIMNGTESRKVQTQRRRDIPSGGTQPQYLTLSILSGISTQLNTFSVF